jgi:alkylated DNA repair protein (DNA oxidative demethylase)
MADLFANDLETIRDGIVLLRGFADTRALLPLIEQIAAISPFRSMTVPGGKSMSVATTSCGRLGWYTDARGYRYETIDPLTQRPWPAMPDAFRTLAVDAATHAGFAGFDPDSCLINRYAPGAKMGAHTDKDELDFNQPIVSVSLGLPAKFKIADATIPLTDGDVVVFGGAARKAKHGVSPVAAGAFPYRFNLTFRRAG